MSKNNFVIELSTILGVRNSELQASTASIRSLYFQKHFKTSNFNLRATFEPRLSIWSAIAKSPVCSSSEMMKLYWLREICVRWKRNDGQLTIAPCSDFCLFLGAPSTRFFPHSSLSRSVSTAPHALERNSLYSVFVLAIDFMQSFSHILFACFIPFMVPSKPKIACFTLFSSISTDAVVFFCIFIGKSLRSFTFTVLFARIACKICLIFFSLHSSLFLSRNHKIIC